MPQSADRRSSSRTSGPHGCADFHRASFSRRKLLQVGGLGLLGMSLPRFLRAQEQASGPPARARAVIFLHQWGGPSHLDTFDMKPDAPDQVRGEFQPVSSSLPSVPICELLPRMAGVLDKCTLVRSMTHRMTNHNSAGYYSLTGHEPPSNDQRLRDSLDLFPAYGSVVDMLAPTEVEGMPTFVAYPYRIRDGSVAPGQHASFLGKAHDPLFVERDPNDPDFALPELSLPDNLSVERLSDRREMQRLIDRQARLLEYSTTAQGADQFFDRALTMLASPRLREAFDLSHEPAELRDRYGRTTYGQSCLLARRLVEAGARFINVYFSRVIGGAGGGWDTHDTNFPQLRDRLLPVTDRAVPALLDDLDERGLLEAVMVVWTGEFGRTPRINDEAGRDHWPQCYTALLAGGGVARGSVYGGSDATGSYPAGDAVTPDDLAATMFYALGIDPHAEVYDPLSRPLPISAGEPLMRLFA